MDCSLSALAGSPVGPGWKLMSRSSRLGVNSQPIPSTKSPLRSIAPSNSPFASAVLQLIAPVFPLTNRPFPPQLADRADLTQGPRVQFTNSPPQRARLAFQIDRLPALRTDPPLSTCSLSACPTANSPLFVSAFSSPTVGNSPPGRPAGRCGSAGEPFAQWWSSRYSSWCGRSRGRASCGRASVCSVRPNRPLQQKTNRKRCDVGRRCCMKQAEITKIRRRGTAL